MATAAAGYCKYTCNTATETLEWINAIINFLKPYRHILDAHVVNFFKDRLWESIDKQWMDCLRHESIENLLKLPSGVVQDHWPASLKDFVLTLRSLGLSRAQETTSKIVPDLHVTPVSTVLAQGMNFKKKHEVEVLAAVISSISRNIGVQTVIDVGAGQGYLAQVLSFQHQLSVVAIDASYHHGTVTSARAERIRKHYAAKSFDSRAENRQLNVPRTVACRVLSSETLKVLNDTISHEDNFKQLNMIGVGLEGTFIEGLEKDLVKPPPCNKLSAKSSLVLAGLHACGDLSVTMLRTFVECKEVKAVVSIGCCYNLLSEEDFDKSNSQTGFPMSCGVSSAGLWLGKSARDLGCQSAERWRVLTKDSALSNFETHAFRAAFQMVLHKYYPETLKGSPSIGRQGKALRRQQVRRAVQDHLNVEETTNTPIASSHECLMMERSQSTDKCMEVGRGLGLMNDIALRGGTSCSTMGTDASSLEIRSSCATGWMEIQFPDKYSLFSKFCESGLRRLGLTPSEGIDILRLWTEIFPFTELIGPYWSLRAALGPLVETLLLLDRLLFLQEQGCSVEAEILAIFNPTVSPRNVAIVARKIDANVENAVSYIENYIR